MKRALIIILLIILAIQVFPQRKIGIGIGINNRKAKQQQGNSYYVSATGNDWNNGLSPFAPFQTLDKVNTLDLSGSINKVLFKAGDSWEGTITVKNSGTSTKPITYGSYGPGAKPKIYGSQPITGWTLHTGNIYKATFATTINQLFCDDVKMMQSRLQQTGYNYITSLDGVTPTVKFTAAGLASQVTNYYVDTKLWIRTTDWSNELRTVTASTGNTLTINLATAKSNIGVGYGFILMGKLEFVDSPGEWFFDDATNTVYFWTPNGDTPANYEVRGSTMAIGINVSNNLDYVTVKDLEILQQSETGIFMSNNEYLTIDNCTIKDQENFGTFCLNTSRFSNITNNTISGQNSIGIHFVSGSSRVIGNTISNIGLFNGIGLNGTTLETSGGKGTEIYCNTGEGQNTIQYNHISNTGWVGLYFRGNTFVNRNYVTNSCLVKDDGGCIYFPGQAIVSGSVVSENIVSNAVGNREGFTSTQRKSVGIYGDFGEATSGTNVLIENNTVLSCYYAGIFLHVTDDYTVNRNTIYDTRYGILISGEYGPNTIKNNTIYSLVTDVENIEGYQLAVHHAGTVTSEVSDSNIYINPFTNFNLFRKGSTYYADIAAWRTATGQEANSTIRNNPLAVGEYSLIFTNNTKYNQMYYTNSATARDIEGNAIAGSFILQPFTSKIVEGLGIDNISLINGYTAPANTVDLNAGLLLLYEMEETTGTAVTSATSTYGATNTNATLQATGVVDKCYQFVRTNSSYLTTAHNVSLKPATWTISYRIRTDAASAGLIFKAVNTLSTGGLHSYASTNNNMKLAYGSGSATQTELVFRVPYKGFHTISITYNGTDLTLYKDGEIVAQKLAAAFGWGVSSSDMTIGKLYGSFNYLDGYIDSFAMWNVALTSAQVLRFHNKGTGLRFEDF